MATTHLVIIGSGVAGAFAAYAAARLGARVTLLERYAHGHANGSSHGGSRIFRHAYEQGDYVRLAVRAGEGWQALERDVGERLVWRAGGLDFGARDDPGLQRIESALREHGSTVERLDAHEVRRRFPAFAPGHDTVALFQPDAGVVAADRALTAALRRAADLGATLRFETPVARLSSDGGGVVAHLDGGEQIRADRGIVAAGPWLADGPLALDLPLRVQAQQVVYLSVPPGRDHGADAMPVFIDRATHLYGLGRLENPAAIKVAMHDGAPTVRLAERPEHPDLAWADATAARAAQLLPAVGARVAAATCLYTRTPDDDFLIGPHPRLPGLTVVGGLSGHGFKFGPVLGEMAAELAMEGSSRWWAPRFATDRFGAPGASQATDQGRKPR